MGSADESAVFRLGLWSFRRAALQDALLRRLDVELMQNANPQRIVRSMWPSASKQSPWPVLYRLRQVRRLDLRALGQIGDGARQLEDAVVGPRGEP